MICSAGKSLKHSLDLKPRDEKDYYRIGNWMFGKKLVFFLMILAGGISLLYLTGVKPEGLQKEAGLYRTYKYNSLRLKLLKGRAVILGKSGYRAYEGDVELGMVKGKGKLYGREGNLIYEGEFDDNAYNGKGEYYYGSGVLAYEGEFKDNSYEGTGRLYRENGTLKYEGEFHKGYMEGEGVLYNGSKEAVYTGSFVKNEVLYQEFLGKTTKEGAQMYTGEKRMYDIGDGFLVSMRDIGAVFFTREGENALEEDFLISGIYVLKNTLWLSGKEGAEIYELTEYFGKPSYQGYTYLSREDAVALSEAASLQKDFYNKTAAIETEKLFDDVFSLKDYEKNCEFYIYVYVKDDLSYTFFSQEKNQGFAFYMIQKE